MLTRRLLLSSPFLAPLAKLLGAKREPRVTADDLYTFAPIRRGPCPKCDSPFESYATHGRFCPVGVARRIEITIDLQDALLRGDVRAWNLAKSKMLQFDGEMPAAFRHITAEMVASRA